MRSAGHFDRRIFVDLHLIALRTALSHRRVPWKRVVLMRFAPEALGVSRTVNGLMTSQKRNVSMLKQLLNDEGGFIVSAELILIATLCVIGLVVGLSEIQHSINAELNDIADAIGALNQSFFTSGFHKRDVNGVVHAATFGSIFIDTADDCDNNQCDMSCDAPIPEGPKAPRP